MKQFPDTTETIGAAWLDSHDWMLRSSNDGFSHDEYKWPEIGRWAKAVDWDGLPACGNGFHGMTPHANGFGFSYKRLELCETRGPQIAIDDEKVKVAEARIVAIGRAIPVEAFERCGYKILFPEDGETISPRDREIYFIERGHVTVSGQTGGYCWFDDSSQGTVFGQRGGNCRFYDSSQGTVFGQTGGNCRFADSATKRENRRI